MMGASTGRRQREADMYVPSQNRMDDRAEQLAFMRQYSFATLVTSDSGGLRATHLPFTVAERDGAPRLLAHLARANPQSAHFAGGEALVIFQGPHAYISPSLYQRHPSVPTWNYAAVHAYGRLRVMEGAGDKLGLLRQLVSDHDPDYLEQLASLPPEFLALKLDGIVAFEIAVTRLEARWKLSQERTAQERQAIAGALARSADSAAPALAAMTPRQA